MQKQAGAFARAGRSSAMLFAVSFGFEVYTAFYGKLTGAPAENYSYNPLYIRGGMVY